MNRHPKRLVEAVAPSIAYWYLRLLQLTTRRSYRNQQALAQARGIGGPYIMAFWHSRLLLMRFGYPDDNAVVLQSHHRDSQMLGRVMSRFGTGQVWGSTTRGGMTAVREVLRRIRLGHDVAIAPDGPRGPRRRAQSGVITIARLSGKAIVPMAYSARWARRLSSWDRLLVPLPFSRALYLYGEPLVVGRRVDDGEEERLRQRLEDVLNRLTDEVDREMGIPRTEPAPLDDDLGRVRPPERG
ncbi:MAG TPA: lysophospholipid acyltransferase family protein [Candidatus Polarisedimenticolaceae bacterium]|nr:lysophospholipid acyltransferase family protein [Candidatus Polarisedimenticolaceae bacterium]